MYEQEPGATFHKRLYLTVKQAQMQHGSAGARPTRPEKEERGYRIVLMIARGSVVPNLARGRRVWSSNVHVVAGSVLVAPSGRERGAADATKKIIKQGVERGSCVLP
jgi:hypothetical protein